MMTQGQSLFFLTAVLLFGLGLHLLPSQQNHENLNSVDRSIDREVIYQFNQFQEKYAKQYISQEEELFRMKIFYENLLYIEDHQGDKWSLAINELADLTFSEMVASKLGLRRPTHNKKNRQTVDQVKSNYTPGQVNWVKQGKTPPVQNQGSCGSCWAFSASEAIDSLYAVENNQNVQVSVQQLVSCSSSYGNEGCNGGWMDDAFSYTQANPLTSSSDYPYTGTDSECNTTAQSQGKYGIKSYVDVESENCEDLQRAIDRQPVSVAVDASYDWFFYSSGILSNCGVQLNHGVLAVGYSITKNLDTSYWLVQNSWGTGWGQNGLIQIAVVPTDTQQDPNQGTCGICMVASYPTL